MGQRKTRYLALCALCFYLIAVANDRPALYAMFGLSLSLGVVCWLLAWLGLRNLTVDRPALPRRLQGGEPLPLRLTLANGASLAKGNLELTELVRHQDGEEVTRTVLVHWLGGGGALPIDPPRVPARRGQTRLGPLSVTSGDPLGLFELRRSLDPAPRELLVHPATFPLPHLVGDGAWGGQASQHARASQGFDFRGLRDYQHGDDLRHLDWKATARTGRLHVREYDRPAAHTAAVVLDLHPAQTFGQGDQASLEVAVSVAASVMLRLQELGYRARLLACDEAPFVLPLRPGHPNLPLLDRLAAVPAAATLNLRQLLRHDADSLAGDRLLVVVTADASPAVAEDLARSRGAGRLQALVVLLDAARFGPPATPAEPRRRRAEPAPGPDPTRCETFRRILAGTAVDVVTLGPGDDCTHAIRTRGRAHA